MVESTIHPGFVSRNALTSRSVIRTGILCCLPETGGAVDHSSNINKNNHLKTIFHINTLKTRDIIIIFFITFTSFFVIGELLARILKEPIPMFVKSENEKLVYELNTHYEGINSFGMRDQEIDMNEIKDLYKIAVIGDSHAYSIKAKTTEETFPYQIEQHINQSMGRRLVKVLNFGAP